MQTSDLTIMLLHSSGARGVHALEGAGTTEEWWGYDQEGYDNSEYVQGEDPDDQWEWDEDAQVGTMLPLQKEREVPSVTCADVVGTWPSSVRPI